MPICKDCLQDVPKVGTRTGVCPKCYTRQRNAKTQGREYIPVKDLSVKERKKYYERVNALEKARNKKSKNSNIIKTTIIKDDGSLSTKPKRKSVEEENEENFTENLINKIAYGNEKLYKEILKLLNIDELEVRNRVTQDIKAECDRRCIKLDYDNHLPLAEIIEGLYALCQNNNYLTEYVPANSLYNDLLSDYQHQNENAKLENLKDFIEKAIMENELLIQRRPIRNIVLLTECVSDLISYLKQDTRFMNLLDKSYNDIKEEHLKQQNPKYFSKASEQIVGTGNVETRRVTKTSWDVSVPCYNL